MSSFGIPPSCRCPVECSPLISPCLWTRVFNPTIPGKQGREYPGSPESILAFEIRSLSEAWGNHPIGFPHYVPLLGNSDFIFYQLTETCPVQSEGHNSISHLHKIDLPGNLGGNLIYKRWPCPGQVAQVVGILSYTPKSCVFNSQSGHIPTFPF